MRLRDTVAVVTGGGTGIGRAIAHGLAEAGARGIVVNYSRSADDDDQVRAMADQVRSRFDRVDIVINNAAITYPVAHEDLAGLTDEMFHRVLDINVLGPFRVVRAFAEDLKAARGAVVNIASISGYRAGGSSIAYGVSKAALVQLTRNLAVALAPHVRVNTIAPGTVATRWQTGIHGEAGFAERAEAERNSVPLRETSDPVHVAQAVLGVLAMDMVTGEAVIVDGGKHIMY
jgi:NAD(P)-dependent dehydrogenase (short-subunit alcohol dehydrogenase family)